MADLKLKDLRYLVAVADTRHFGQAAARCFVSQPTLSAQLKKLEEYLGVQLASVSPQVALHRGGHQGGGRRARRIIEGQRGDRTLTQQQKDPLLTAACAFAAACPRSDLICCHGGSAHQQELPRWTFSCTNYQTGPMLEHLQAGDN